MKRKIFSKKYKISGFFSSAMKNKKKRKKKLLMISVSNYYFFFHKMKFSAKDLSNIDG